MNVLILNTNEAGSGISFPTCFQHNGKILPTGSAAGGMPAIRKKAARNFFRPSGRFQVWEAGKGD
jgi:hypothetical protein